MTDVDPLETRRDQVTDIPAELWRAGFEDVEEIGRGGFGVVYRCAQPSLDRAVAVKVLTTDLDPDNLDRFVREQRAMGRLSGHPHIMNVLQVGVLASGRPFIVMPYYVKNSLQVLVRRHGPLGWRETLTIGVKLAGALDAAHRAGTLHRDVKPGNVLVTDYGEPQLTDFGIARIAGGFETATGVIAGSPAYTAPEVLEGRSSTPASDVYSLGATLFCLLTGHAVYERRSGEQVVAQFLRVTSQDLPDLDVAGLPADVAAIIARAMARDPAERPASAAEFGDELREVQQRNGLTVDDMPRPVELGVERQKSSGTHPFQRNRDAASTFETPPTPATKYRPSVPTRSLVARGRLLDVLRGGGRRRLVLMHAPSGFGKSTLAAQWRDELASDDIAVSWLTVDDDDNNAVWFLAHLLESIRRVRPAVAESFGQLLEEYGDDACRYVLTALVDEIHEKDEALTVVIDDWQRVTDSQTTAALGFLLDNGCDHLQVIVTSWSRAGLPLGKLRIRDEVIEIDSGALRFNTDEAASLLNDVGGLQLSRGDVEALTASTDGWAAALQLATLSLRGGGDAGSLLRQLCGSSDVIREFLGENVLDILDGDLREFLLATSVTERTCAGLASALAGVTNGQAWLEDVEQRGLFLQRIDDDLQWFRFHQMFADFLRRRHERDRPERVVELHRAASTWFVENGYLNEAVDHALAAGDPTRAVELVEQDETNLLEQSKMTTLLGIVKKLPQQLVVPRPRIQLVIAWANILLQRSVRADSALDRFAAALGRADLPDAMRADLRTEADVLRAVADALADRVERIDELVAEAMSRPNSLHPRVPASAGTVAAFAAICRFDFGAADQLLDWAAPYQEIMGPFSAVYGHCYRSMAARHRLDIPAALENCRAALEIANGIGSHSHAARLAGSFLGELLYETGDLVEAARLLDDSFFLGSDGGGVDYLAAGYVIGARIKAGEGNLGLAADRLSAGSKAAVHLRLPRLAARINNERIRLGIGIPPVVAAELLSPRTIPRDSGIATMTAELNEDSAVRLLSGSAAADDREQACRRATDLIAAIDGERRPLAALNAHVLRIEAFTAVGRGDDARVALGPIAAQCAQLGLSRLLVDAGLT
ncbi:protein kinase domain-containing protein [Mycobacterium sp.]|uniref:protein kinase domain-containing protein n=1 Tax=Mycobacterium sp. TaxID=1785 RepID=UPI003A851AEC